MISWRRGCSKECCALGASCFFLLTRHASRVCHHATFPLHHRCSKPDSLKPRFLSVFLTVNTFFSHIQLSYKRDSSQLSKSLSPMPILSATKKASWVIVHLLRNITTANDN